MLDCRVPKSHLPHNGLRLFMFFFLLLSEKLSRNLRARCGPPRPKANRHPSIKRAKHNRKRRKPFAWRCLSPRVHRTRKDPHQTCTDQLSSVGDRYPAFTAAKSTARERKFAVTSPKNKIKMAQNRRQEQKQRDLFLQTRDTQHTGSIKRSPTTGYPKPQTALNSSVMEGALPSAVREKPPPLRQTSASLNAAIRAGYTSSVSAMRNPTATMTSITTKRGRNSASMSNQILGMPARFLDNHVFMASPQLFAFHLFDQYRFLGAQTPGKGVRVRLHFLRRRMGMLQKIRIETAG